MLSPTGKIGLIVMKMLGIPHHRIQTIIGVTGKVGLGQIRIQTFNIENQTLPSRKIIKENIAMRYIPEAILLRNLHVQTLSLDRVQRHQPLALKTLAREIIMMRKISIRTQNLVRNQKRRLLLTKLLMMMNIMMILTPE